MLTIFSHTGHDHTAESMENVATSSMTADIAYFVCIVSFFIAAGIALYLLKSKVDETKAAPAKKAKAATTKKAVTKKKPAAKKPVVKKKK